MIDDIRFNFNVLPAITFCSYPLVSVICFIVFSEVFNRIIATAIIMNKIMKAVVDKVSKSSVFSRLMLYYNTELRKQMKAFRMRIDKRPIIFIFLYFSLFKTSLFCTNSIHYSSESMISSLASKILPARSSELSVMFWEERIC